MSCWSLCEYEQTPSRSVGGVTHTRFLDVRTDVYTDGRTYGEEQILMPGGITTICSTTCYNSAHIIKYVSYSYFPWSILVYAVGVNLVNAEWICVKTDSIRG